MRTRRIAALCMASALALPAAAAEISASKRALVAELIALSAGPEARASVVDLFLRQLEPHYAALVSQLVREEEEQLEPGQRAALAAGLADFDAFSAAFATRFPEEVDLEAVLVETYVPLYDRYFEERELAEIVAFYRSPAGQKMMRVLPELIQDGIARTTRRIEPELQRMVGLVLVERRRELLDGDDVR